MDFIGFQFFYYPLTLTIKYLKDCAYFSLLVFTCGKVLLGREGYRNIVFTTIKIKCFLIFTVQILILWICMVFSWLFLINLFQWTHFFVYSQSFHLFSLELQPASNTDKKNGAKLWLQNTTVCVSFIYCELFRKVQWMLHFLFEPERTSKTGSDFRNKKWDSMN